MLRAKARRRELSPDVKEYIELSKAITSPRTSPMFKNTLIERRAAIWARLHPWEKDELLSLYSKQNLAGLRG